MKVNSENPEPNIRELIMEYQQTSCNEIATTLLLQLEPLVKMAAGKMSRNRPDLYEDLYQVGQMSMLRLFKQFDVEQGEQFEPYMMKSVIGHMKNYLRDKSWYVQVPRRVKEKGGRIQEAIDRLTVLLERSPNVEEIAADVELTVEETIEILAGREYYHYVSLDTPLSFEESGSTIGDLLSEDVDEYRQLENRLDMEQAMKLLKKEEQRVLQLSYVEGQSQRMIAQVLNVSQMSVSRIQKRALDKLKEYFVESGGMTE
ncbi:sigma-70 family RNA polymerase sigma factor [Paenibacillus sp. LMG 31456]|uniref:Sigma-70 family RNA polymerase sigma factor n=1 Tax=Paenibacillus foliorum TaxID=2654974 RepID=A0A972GXZ4_9BACL|nr:sigma-70 family RNA polymerase sigma factor [Paenibacillus foliorum]NOU94950.1 sigma-70 family RNA polymerase sigma factor [Paenibacillus foliorum]